MTTVIANATIVTGNAGRDVLHDAAIAIAEDRIAAIGPTDDVRPAHPDAEVVDGRGKAVFPGLINCHTHLLATGDRGILEDFGFPTRLTFPVSARGLLTDEERRILALLGVLESIRSGVTCLLEISSNVAGYAPDLAATGLRLVLSENINDVDEAQVREGVFRFDEARADAGLQRSADLVDAWHGRENGRVSCFLAPHAPETCSPDLLRRAREMAERLGVRYTIHLSQSREEIEAVMRVRGVPPTHYLFASGFLGPGLLAAHCRYVNPAEIALLGQTGVKVTNNAAIAARRGAAAPVRELQAAGCVIGMGTDNMAEDMVEVMRAGLFLERVRRNDEVWPQPEDVLDWATAGGARALGMQDITGSLEVGKKADLFVADLMRPHLVPSLRPVSAFVHNGQPGDITSVMVDGAWVMRDGKVLTIDEEDVVRRAEAVGHASWRRLLDRYPNVPFPINIPPPIS